VSATADPAEDRLKTARRLGLEPGQVVQELGYDEDSDQEFREAVEELLNTELVDEEYGDVADAVLLWYRDDEEDGDLTDTLVDALEYLAEGGLVWLLTPKTGRPGHVEPQDIADAAKTAGLSQTSTLTVGKDWVASRLASPKSSKK
jgi:hypothetical protein